MKFHLQFVNVLISRQERGSLLKNLSPTTSSLFHPLANTHSSLATTSGFLAFKKGKPSSSSSFPQRYPWKNGKSGFNNGAYSRRSVYCLKRPIRSFTFPLFIPRFQLLIPALHFISFNWNFNRKIFSNFSFIWSLKEAARHCLISFLSLSKVFLSF